MKYWKLFAACLIAILSLPHNLSASLKNAETRIIPIFNSEIDFPVQCPGAQILKDDSVMIKEVQSQTNGGKALFEVTVKGVRSFRVHSDSVARYETEGSRNILIQPSGTSYMDTAEINICGPFLVILDDDFGKFDYMEMSGDGIFTKKKGKYIYTQNDPTGRFAAHTSVYSIEKDLFLRGCRTEPDKSCSARLISEKRPDPRSKGTYLATAVLEVENPYSIESVEHHDIASTVYDNVTSFANERTNFNVAYNAKTNKYQVGVAFSAKGYMESSNLQRKDIPSQYTVDEFFTKWIEKDGLKGDIAFVPYEWATDDAPAGEIVYTYEDGDRQVVCGYIDEKDAQRIKGGRVVEANPIVSFGCRSKAVIDSKRNTNKVAVSLEVRTVDSQVVREWLDRS